MHASSYLRAAASLRTNEQPITALRLKLGFSAASNKFSIMVMVMSE
jgi:hypothetical protein